MMEEVGIRSVRHLWHRRWEVGDVERKEVGWGGEDEGEEEVLVVLVVVAEERRRRKGRLGRR